jgi:hypothetical protein
MKRIPALFFFALPLAAQVVALCGTPDDPGATSVSSLTVTCTPTTGAFLIITGVTGPTITQTIAGGSNTFVAASNANLTGFPNWVYGADGGTYNIWLVSSANAGSTTFTITNSASSPYNSMTVTQITGGSGVLQCGNKNSQSGTVAVGDCVTSSANEVIFSLANRYAGGGATTQQGSNSTSCPGSITQTSLFSSSGSGAATQYFIAPSATNYYACWNSGSGGIDLDAFVIGINVVVTANPSVFGIAVQ